MTFVYDGIYFDYLSNAIVELKDCKREFAINEETGITTVLHCKIKTSRTGKFREVWANEEMARNNLVLLEKF